MGSPITLVKFLIKEADSHEACVQCGWKGKGLASFVFYIFYVDPFTGELMVSGWSFPFCQEHIPEEIIKYPADQPVMTEQCSPVPLEIPIFPEKDLPPPSRKFVPRAC